MKIRRIDFYPDDWLAGVVELSDDERGIYMQACMLIYSRGGPINISLLKRGSSSHGNAFNRILKRLEETGKLTRNGEEITQKRCENELERARKRAENASENASKRWNNNDIEKRAALPPSNARGRDNQQSTTNIEKEERPNGLSKKERGSRIGDDFKIPDAWFGDGAKARATAGLPEINLELEAEKFLDFWRGKSGKDGVKLNWLATWRNWCRNARGVPITNGHDVPEDEIQMAIRNAPLGSSSDNKLWRARVALYLKHNTWIARYGLPPGSEGTNVPVDVLRDYGFVKEES